MFSRDDWLFFVMMIWFLVLIVLLLRKFYNDLMRRKWDRGESPDIEEMGGRYRVWMRPLWLFFWFLNTKRIESKGNLSREGQNTAYGIIKWGNFYAATTISRGMTFFYGAGDSGKHWKIRDYIVRTGPGKYLGKFCLRRGKREIFLFWFTLTKR